MRILAAVVGYVFITALLWAGDLRSEDDAGQEAPGFTDRFLAAYESGGQEAADEYTKAAGPAAAFAATIAEAWTGISTCAKGEDPELDRLLSESMASAYQQVFSYDLYALVRSYNSLSPPECRELILARRTVDAAVDLYLSNKTDESFRRMKSVEVTLTTLGDDKGLADALTYQGMYHGSKGDLSDALDAHQRAGGLYRNIGDLAGLALAQSQVGFLYRRLRLFTEALGHHRTSLSIYENLGDIAGQAGENHAIGICKSGQGRDAEATSYYSAAIGLARNLGDKAQEAESQEAMAWSLSRLGHLEKAIFSATDAAMLYGDALDSSGMIRSLQSAAQYQEALGQYEASGKTYAAIEKACRAIADRACLMDSMIARGDIGIRNGQLEAALASYQKAYKLSLHLKASEQGRALNYLGIASQSLGRLADAFDYYRRAAEKYSGKGDEAYAAGAQTSMAVLYDFVGQDTKSLEHYRKAMSLYDKAGLPAGVALCRAGIGGVLADMGRYDDALEQMSRALDIQRDPVGRASVLTEIGNTYREAGKIPEAISSLQSALSAIRVIGDPRREVPIRVSFGRTYLQSQRYNDALDAYRQAAVNGGDSLEPATGFAINAGLAHALWKLGNLAEAEVRYDRAIGTLESLHGSAEGLGEESRSAMLMDRRHVFREFIGLLLELHRAHPDSGYGRKAFLISEKGKSRAFRNLMEKAGARLAFAGDEAFQARIRRERELSRQLGSLRTHLSNEIGRIGKRTEIISSLEQQIRRVEDGLRRAEGAIEQAYPRYADLKRTKDMRIEDLQAVLRSDETVVAYAIGVTNSAAFLVRRDLFRVYELNVGGGELTAEVSRLRKGLSSLSGIGGTPGSEPFDPELAHRLYRLLVAPMSADIADSSMIMICADDVLHTVPFEAFVSREPDMQSFRASSEDGSQGDKPYLSEFVKLQFLVDDHAFVYLPSATVLRSQRIYPKVVSKKWQRPLIAFADPVFSSGEERPDVQKGEKTRGISVVSDMTKNALEITTGGFVLSRLEETADEAKAIALAVGGKTEDIFLGSRATEANLYKDGLHDARYLLFATHGLLGGEFQGIAEPSLVLTLVGNPTGIDGFLSMSEVLGLDLNAELAVLSACNTSGEGTKAGKGEGFAGLTRSFMYAGVKSLMVTHWSVESQAATDLMVQTFRNARQVSKAEALRRAKLAMKDSFRPAGTDEGGSLSLSHPYFWAPYVLVGDHQ